jgi:hypothetical protein
MCASICTTKPRVSLCCENELEHLGLLCFQSPRILMTSRETYPSNLTPQLFLFHTDSGKVSNNSMTNRLLLVETDIEENAEHKSRSSFARFSSKKVSFSPLHRVLNERVNECTHVKRFAGSFWSLCSSSH